MGHTGGFKSISASHAMGLGYWSSVLRCGFWCVYRLLSCACVLMQPQNSAHMSKHIHTCSNLDSPKSEHMPIMHTLHATAFMEPVRNIHWSRHGNALSICSGSKARVTVCHISNFYVVIYICLHYNVNFYYGIIIFRYTSGNQNTFG